MADPRVEAAVRLVHVLAMAVVVGGATAIWAMVRRAGPEQMPPMSTALRYERWFWAAVGLLVMTGVGNVGALGDAFPPFTSTRGLVFAVKFGLVLALLILSLLRMLVIARLASLPARSLTDIGRRAVTGWYRTTALTGGGIAALGVLVAHGGL